MNNTNFQKKNLMNLFQLQIHQILIQIKSLHSFQLQEIMTSILMKFLNQLLFLRIVPQTSKLFQNLTKLPKQLIILLKKLLHLQNLLMQAHQMLNKLEIYLLSLMPHHSPQKKSLISLLLQMKAHLTMKISNYQLPQLIPHHLNLMTFYHLLKIQMKAHSNQINSKIQQLLLMKMMLIQKMLQKLPLLLKKMDQTSVMLLNMFHQLMILN